jgi:hypothetical protein
MNPLYWIAWSGICAFGTGVLVYFVMQSRMEVLLSKQREELAAARATLGTQKDLLETSLRNVEESARRKAMDDFLAEIRIEERHYVREQKVFFATRKSMIRQERVFFRNIPLSSWMEHEMPFEEGADMEKLVRDISVLAASTEFPEAARLLR